MSASVEGSAGGGSRAWSLLGDVELREGTTFLTLGYTAARPGAGTATTHPFSLGGDHLVGRQGQVSAVASVGHPKSTLTSLAPERPRLSLPAVQARTGYSSQALLLSAAWDSAGFSDREYGLDASLCLTRYPLSREIEVSTRTGPPLRYLRETRLLGGAGLPRRPPAAGDALRAGPARRPHPLQRGPAHRRPVH